MKQKRGRQNRIHKTKLKKPKQKKGEDSEQNKTMNQNKIYHKFKETKLQIKCNLNKEPKIKQAG